MRIVRELLLGFICIAEAAVIPSSLESEDNLAPLYKAISDDKIPETYLVTLHKDVDYHDHFKTIGRDLEADSSTGFKWWDVADSYYATNITSDWLCKIRQDAAVHSIDEYEPWDLIRPPPAQNTTVLERDSQAWYPVDATTAPWHLQAISAGSKLADMPKLGPSTQIKYNNTVGGGQGVNIYILDSGVDIEHKDFGGRARNFHNCYVDVDGECFKDLVGHGTAVAGAAAGKYYGTAQGANIINVKTFFSFNKRKPQTIPSDLLSALKDILAEHLANVENPPPGFRGSVVNMSIGQNSPGGNSMWQIIDRLYMAGVPVVAAAGNDREAGVSADNIWPCKMNSICVGAINKQYQQESYSNIGGNVTVFAPGTDIITLDTGGRTITKSGTSFAAPLVTGVLATFMGWENLGYEGLDNPNLIRSRLDANLIRGIITDKYNGADLGASENNFVTSGINHPGRPDSDPYNGVGEGIDNTYQTDYNPFEVATAIGDFSLNSQPTEDPQPTPIVGPTSTETFSELPAATTATEIDDNVSNSTGDINDAGEPVVVVVPTPTSDDRPKIITPTGDGHGCLYKGCPDGYICNTVGNCLLL